MLITILSNFTPICFTCLVSPDNTACSIFNPPTNYHQILFSVPCWLLGFLALRSWIIWIWSDFISSCHSTTIYLCWKFGKFTNTLKIFIHHWHITIKWGCLRCISHHRSIIWIKVWNRGWVVESWCKTKVRHVLSTLVGKLIWMLIIVGILVAKWVIRRILGVEMIIIGIDFTKKTKT